MKNKTVELTNESVMNCLERIIQEQQKKKNDLEVLLSEQEAKKKCGHEQQFLLDWNHNYFSVECNSNHVGLNNEDFRREESECDIQQKKAEMQENTEILEKLLQFIGNSEEELFYNPLGSQENMRYKILDALEMDRNRIARDLHDSTVQLLTMLVHKAELCEKLVNIDAIRTKMELHTMMNCLKDSIKELRRTIYNLRPMSIDDLGLVPTVERYLVLLRQNCNIRFSLEVVNQEKGVRSIVKLSLYRIIQEACNNIVKHSKASDALIKIVFGEERIEVWIQDNGIGIKELYEENDKISEVDLLTFNNIQKIRRPNRILNGFGMSILQERVYLLLGRMDLNTDSNGTSIYISIPMIHEEEERNEIN